jgi:alkyl hydroperoxide reductase subunit F
MSMFQPEIEKQLLEILSAMEKSVKIILFKQAKDCPTCPEQEKLLSGLAERGDNLSLEVYDLVLHGDKAMSFNVNRAPATIIMDEKDYGIRFYGLTAGHEFSSLLSSILLVSNGTEVNQQLVALIESIETPVHLKVMTTLTCPYCPKMVAAAQIMAYMNPNIIAEAFDVSEYPDLTKKYNVTGVPMTFINEVGKIDGVASLPELVVEVMKVAEPEKYRDLEESIRESLGTRNVSPIETDHTYDTIIVGGGPAGISAAVYGIRKGLDVAMVSQTFGGQLVYTAKIDNYLGLGGIDGNTMIEVFRNQMEQYPIAQEVGVVVSSIQKEDNVFKVALDDDLIYTARTVILSTGMEYTRLGVPGEDALIGKGIGFCATCDAPLYRDRKVAVIGGGNSAFTAVRDLLGYASEITLIHRRDEFTADSILTDEILGNEKVHLLPFTKVVEFHGEDRLTGVTIETENERSNLEVDGVFIEIGLTPNSSPVENIVQLNENGEVLIDQDGSTSVPGIFAAGDVTQIKDKQISISVGQGTIAALSAYRFIKGD